MMSNLRFVENCLLQPVGNPATGQVIGGKLYLDLITRKNPDKVFSNLTRNMCKDHQTVFELNPKHSVWERFVYSAFHFDDVFGHRFYC